MAREQRKRTARVEHFEEEIWSLMERALVGQGVKMEFGDDLGRRNQLQNRIHAFKQAIRMEDPGSAKRYARVTCYKRDNGVLWISTSPPGLDLKDLLAKAGVEVKPPPEIGMDGLTDEERGSVAAAQPAPEVKQSTTAPDSMDDILRRHGYIRPEHEN